MGNSWELVAEGDKVRRVGDRIAIVVAESERTAAQARDLIRVDYEVLLTVDDPRQAMQPGAPLVHEDGENNVLKHIPIRKGDVEQGLAQADVIVEGRYTTHCVEHAYMQPDAALGYVDEQRRITIITSCQWPADDLHQIAHMLNLPEDQVREIVPAVGGAFGGREDMYIQHLAALCAFVVRRPVKIVFDREEVTQRTGKRHPFYLRHRTGATRDGHIVAAEVEVISDAGAYASTSIPVLNNAATFALGPYKIPHARVDAYTVYTNNAVTMAMRGFGATQPPFGYEGQMDKLAKALGMDPVEIRMKNLFWSAVDAGTMINPLTYFGQQAGGVHMGVGYALIENYIQQQGRPRTRRFSEYHIPTVLDMPRELVSIAVETAPDPQGPFGATGMGETTTLPTAPAILSAIHDATGVWISDLPASPERLWQALQHGSEGEEA